MEGGGRVIGPIERARLWWSSPATSRGFAIGLEEAHRGAEGASRAKSRLLAAVSHELATPLNAVIGFSERLLICDLEQAAPDHRRGCITDILDYPKREADRSAGPFHSGWLRL